jgi:hypothetical protein
MKARFVSLVVILLSVYGIAAVDGFALTLVVTKTDFKSSLCDGLNQFTSPQLVTADQNRSDLDFTASQ